MLVLSRKVDERIRIGPDVVITVVRIRGSIVAIGIDAPKSIDIAREELTDFSDDDGPRTTRPVGEPQVRDLVAA